MNPQMTVSVWFQKSVVTVVFALLVFVSAFSFQACDPVLYDEGTNKEKKAGDSATDASKRPDPRPPVERRLPPEPRPEPRTEPPKEQTTPDVSDASEPVADKEPVQEVTPEPDQPPPDNGPPPAKCGDVTFQYTGAATTVLVSGEFNGWKDSVAAGAYPMKKGSGNDWSYKTNLKPGGYQYKLIVDGKWIIDPGNPKTVPNEFGGKNSLLEVPECARPTLKVTQHSTQSSNFTATLQFSPGQSGSALANINLATLDGKAVAASAVKLSGSRVSVNLTGLAKGIHDLRIQGTDKAGEKTSLLFLKVYVGVSKDWRDVVLYFAMIDRFLNGDKSNDKPIPNTPKLLNYMGGDFKGLSQKIDDGYFTKLGVNAIWITWPIDNPDYSEPGKRFGGHQCKMGNNFPNMVNTRYSGFHGYWPANLNKIEEHFGTLKELQEMVNKAHKKGIRILLDFTVNHVHKESDLWKKYKDKGYFNTPAKVCGQDVGWDQAPETCWFVDYLPDLNYNKSEVRKLMLDHMVYWVKTIGADGLRVDALKHIAQIFIKEMRKRTTKEFEQTGISFYMVGETFSGLTSDIKKYVSKDQVQGQFDFPLNSLILRAFAKEQLDMNKLDSGARGIMNDYGPDALMSTFIGNHDIARFISMASNDMYCGVWDILSNRAQTWTAPPKVPSTKPWAYAKLKLAFTYIFTLPGIPLIYYGDEIGLPGAGDPDNRRMMRFGSSLGKLEGETLAYMQKLGQIRQKYAVLRRGAMGPTLTSSKSVLVFSRTHSSGTAIVAFNRNNATSVTVTVSSLGFSDGDKLTNVLGTNTVTVSGGKITLSLGTQSAMILLKNP